MSFAPHSLYKIVNVLKGMSIKLRKNPCEVMQVSTALLYRSVGIFEHSAIYKATFRGYVQCLRGW